MFELSENPLILENGLELSYIKDIDGSNYVFKLVDTRVPFDEDKWEKTVFEIDSSDPCYKLLRKLEKQLDVCIIREPKDTKYKHTIGIKKCDVLKGKTYKAVYFNAFQWENGDSKGVSLRFVNCVEV